VAEVDGDDDMPAEAGSFFNFFEIADDPFEVSVVDQSLQAPNLTYFLDWHANCQ
jgi:template-activating factor I